jgi:hypothetical protein
MYGVHLLSVFEVGRMGRDGIPFLFKKLETIPLLFNPSAWRHLIPGQYCAVGGFSSWVFKFESESAKHC